MKDILPVLISSVALVISVLMPYLLIRYEKAFSLNKEYRDFLGQAEIFFLEWLNVSSYNTKLIEEFLSVNNNPQAIFVKDFQFYDFPAINFFKTYNNELLNEFYVQVRKLKGLDHHLRIISAEYAAYKRMKGSKDAIHPQNGNDFFVEALTGIKEQYPKIVDDLVKLRIKVRLLLKEVNKISSLKINRFFSFGQANMLWYKKDLKFSDEQIQEEITLLEKEKKEGRENP